MNRSEIIKAVERGELPECAKRWIYEGENRNYGYWCMDCWAVVGSIACHCLYEDKENEP